MTDSCLLRCNYALSAKSLSHAETPLGFAFFRYPTFSCGVQRKPTRAVAGFLRGGLPLGFLAGSMLLIMYAQIIIDKPSVQVLTVLTLNRR